MTTLLDKESTERFVKLVADMRTAQRNYFKTKDRAYFYVAKNLERDVDRFLDQWNHPNLF